MSAHTIVIASELSTLPLSLTGLFFLGCGFLLRSLRHKSRKSVARQISEYRASIRVPKSAMPKPRYSRKDVA